MSMQVCFLVRFQAHPIHRQDAHFILDVCTAQKDAKAEMPQVQTLSGGGENVHIAACHRIGVSS